MITGFGNGQRVEYEFTPRVMPIPKVEVEYVDSVFLYEDSIEIIFRNLSTISSGGIAKYRNDFGDGSFKIVDNGQLVVSHFYNKTGRYSLRFCVMSSHGCISCINEELAIMPAPNSINDLEHKKIECYKYTDGIMQFIPDEAEKIELYNLDGRLLASSNSQGAVPFHISKNQVFVLKVFADENVYSQKIFTY
ncbi:MAG: PKD domain-containing protein [Bacteroidia bacterium]